MILNNLIVTFVKLLPKSVVYIFAKPYIAGIKLEDGLNTVKELNKKGICATMDVLGESISNLDEAETAANEILEVLDAIDREKLDSNVSVKPTQIGLMLDEDFCYQKMVSILERAKKYNNFIRIDMEDSATTDRIIKLYRRTKEKYENVGIVVQAYLKRTIDDVQKLNKDGAHYRLCKGIYIEPEKIAYRDRQKVRDNFMEILEQMFEDGTYVGIATHDKYLIDKSYELIENRSIEKDKYEFQMLYGVRSDLRDKINSDGHKIRIYVPFGEHWYHYSVRRLQENPVLAWYITKSIFRKK